MSDVPATRRSRSAGGDVGAEPEPEPVPEPVPPEAAALLDEPVGVFGEPTIIWDLPIDGEVAAPTPTPLRTPGCPS